MISDGKTLGDTCNELNLKYQTVASTLSRDEFKARFRSSYSYPKNQQQQSIKEALVANDIEVICNDRTIIKPLELDIFVPSKNLAIEFNGSYWHSEALLDPVVARNKHIKKLKECQSKGIRLIHIFEKNWQDRKLQYLNLISSVCGTSSTKIHARKCDIANLECKEFIDRNHVQGCNHRSVYWINLHYNNTIVGAMTASKHHRQGIDGNPIVLSRMCFADGVTVMGGATKMLSNLKGWAKSQGHDRIISFSDNCISEGNVYRVMGFEMKKESPPDYFYWDMLNNKYVSKQSQQKSLTGCPPEVTEREWSINKGLYRIWDCGKKLWELPI